MGFAAELFHRQRNDTRREVDFLSRYGGVNPYHCIHRETTSSRAFQGCLRCPGKQSAFPCTHPEILAKRRPEHLAIIRLNPKLVSVAYEEGYFVCSHCKHRELFTMPSSPTWSVGVVTAPRRIPTLERTVDSLRRTGWHTCTIFAEPDSPVVSGAKVVMRDRPHGGWSNWYEGVKQLASHGTDMILMCQDDVVFSRNVRAYIERAWPQHAEMVSLFTSSRYWSEETYVAFNYGGAFCGSLALAFPRHVAERMVSDRKLQQTTKQSLYDGTIGEWCKRYGTPIYCSIPTLSQHIGDTSVIHPDSANAGKRLAVDFDEDRDALELLE